MTGFDRYSKPSPPAPAPPARLTVRRLPSVDASLAAQLDLLFDEAMDWDERGGRRFLADPANLLAVAFWDGLPCGFVTAHRPQRFDRRRAEVLLYEIGVDEGRLRRGIGAAMVAEVGRWAAEVGADEVWLLTERANAAAMALYRAGGGVEDGADTVMFTIPVAAAGETSG